MTTKVAIFFAALALSACASPTRQTRDLLRAEMPPVRVLEATPFVSQAKGDCGPAALSMAIQSAGRPVDYAALSAKVMTSTKGSLPSDLTAAARREGLMAIRVEGLQSIAREINAGHPVVVFQNLGIGIWPRWHFALAVGYDLPQQQLVLHSGQQAFRREPLRFFERTWTLADEWALVVLEPKDLSVTAGELEHLKAASALEQLGFVREAGEAYESILSRWPDSLAGLIGAGNSRYALGQRADAIRFLRKASRLHPDSAVAKHNLDVAERSLK